MQRNCRVHVKVFFEARVEKGEKPDVSVEGASSSSSVVYSALQSSFHRRGYSSLDVDNNFSTLRSPSTFLNLFISAGSCFLFYARHSLISFLFQPIITTYKVLAENSALRLVSIINYIY